jgi:hypothetical protein
MLRLRAQLVAQDCHRIPQLLVGQVGSGTQAQDVTARIDEHATTTHLPRQIEGSRSANRKNPARRSSGICSTAATRRGKSSASIALFRSCTCRQLMRRSSPGFKPWSRWKVNTAAAR